MACEHLLIADRRPRPSIVRRVAVRRAIRGRSDAARDAAADRDSTDRGARETDTRRRPRPLGDTRARRTTRSTRTTSPLDHPGRAGGRGDGRRRRTPLGGTEGDDGRATCRSSAAAARRPTRPATRARRRAMTVAPARALAATERPRAPHGDDLAAAVGHELAAQPRARPRSSSRLDASSRSSASAAARRALELRLELEHALDAGEVQPELGGHLLDAPQPLDVGLASTGACPSASAWARSARAPRTCAASAGASRPARRRPRS